jgi:hypothetical protein
MTAGSGRGAKKAPGGTEKAPARPDPPQPSALKRGLLVVGMHRSGTSAITRILSLCGAQLPDHLMPSSEHNPRGYYESQRIYDLHEELLAELGSAWDDVGPLPTDWLSGPTGGRWVERFVAVVREEFGAAPFLTLKDPRVCRLVPLWLRILAKLGYQPNFVIPVRNPLDVAASLHVAEGTAEAKGLLLWLQYFLAAERETRGHPRSFVGYDALLRDWRVVVEQISRDLDLAFPRLGARAAAEIDEFLSNTLRHHATSAAELAGRRAVPRWVKEAHAWAEQAAAGLEPPCDALDQIALEMYPAEIAFGPVVAALEVAGARFEQEASRLRARTEALETSLDRDGQELRTARKEIERLGAHVALRDRQAGEFLDWTRLLLGWACREVHPGEAGRAHLEATLQALEGADAGSLPRLGATAIRLTQQAAELARVSEQADLRTAQAQRLERELAALQQEHEAQRQELERLREERAREGDHLQQQIRGLWQQISARDGELGRLKSEVSTGAAALVHLEADRQALEQQLAARAERIVALESARDEAYRDGLRLIAERDVRIEQLEAQRTRIERSWAGRLLRSMRLLGDAPEPP